jgi:hypothetical protein
VLDKKEFEKLQEEKIKEFNDIYKKIKELKEKYKYLVINFNDENVEAVLFDIQLEENKYKVFIDVNNKTLIKFFKNVNELENFLSICNKAYKKLKK